MDNRNIPIRDIVGNTGQVDGLPRNPRKWNKRDVERLAASIRDTPELLAARGIIVYPHGGKFVAIGGNMRLAALRQLGDEYAPCIVLPESTTIDTLKSVAMKDNGAFGAWDVTMLAADWGNLPLKDWGVAWDDVRKPEPLDDIDEDDVDWEEPPVDVDPVTNRGDVISFNGGRHILVCGDSTEASSYSRMGGCADLLLTDPPYNVGYVGKGQDALTIKNDVMDGGQFVEFLSRAYACCDNHMKDRCAIYIWEAFSNMVEFRQAFTSIHGWNYSQTLIWVKDTFALGHYDYHWRHEPCTYGNKGGRPFFIKNRTLDTIVMDDMGDTSVLRERKPSRNSLHPTMKPLRLMGRLIRNSSREDDLVLDPFGGSGSTMMAAEKLGRRSYLIELDPRYCDAIRNRFKSSFGDYGTIVGSILTNDGYA